MSQVKVTSHLDGLVADLEEIAEKAPVELKQLVKDGIRVGNDLAKANARVTSRRHARKYPGTFTSSMNPDQRFADVKIYNGEYGPLPKGQGLLASILENGSRNNPPHKDLARSADVIGPALDREVGDVVDGLFWPHD